MTLHVGRDVVKLFLLIMISFLSCMVEFKLQFLIRNWFQAFSCLNIYHLLPNGNDKYDTEHHFFIFALHIYFIP